MKTLLLFLILCTVCFADTNNTTSPTNYPYLNQYDIINKYTEENFYLKKNNIIITGAFCCSFAASPTAWRATSDIISLL